MAQVLMGCVRAVHTVFESVERGFQVDHTGQITHCLVFLVRVDMPLLNAGEKLFEDGYGVCHFFINGQNWKVTRM